MTAMQDEPWITLPAKRLLLATVLASAAAALLWAAGALALGYDGTVIAGGAAGAGITVVIASVIFVFTAPWVPKPASTTMLIWLASDVLAMGLALGLAYLLYSATLLGLPPILLGVALAFFLVLLGKAAVVAAFMNQKTFDGGDQPPR